MKKVMVYAYTRLNLGDDLFLKILFERYPKSIFVLFGPKKYKKVFSYKNLIVIPSDNLILRGINFALKRINKRFSLSKFISKFCDASVQIGGSIFQQSENWETKIKYRKNLLNKNQPFYVLGANFGPFNDKEFFLECKNLISRYEDICFRDTYSYNLFKDLNNVRIADDIVFSLKYGSNLKDSYETIVISVIKPSYRSYLYGYDDAYYRKISDLSIKFIKKGFNVILMSFCKYEGDEEAAKEIVNKIPVEYKSYVKQYNYEGNLDESLDIIAKSSLVIGTRFHAMILGWVFNKPVVPIVYSEKMKKVMEDVDFKGIYANLKEIDFLEIDKVVLKSFEKNLIDVGKQRENSENHFKELDELLLK